MTLDDLKRNIERSIVRRQVLSRELEAKAAVTEAEARAEYEARKADYRKSRPCTCRRSWCRTTRGPADLAARARAGEDFAALAREHSRGPSRAPAATWAG